MKIGSIVIRCYEFDKMVAFGKKRFITFRENRQPMLGVVPCDPKGKGPNVSLDKVPDRRSGKRNRLHLDLYTSDQKGEVERLIKLGARRYPWKYQPDDDFIKLQDPVGNDLCVVQKSGVND